MPGRSVARTALTIFILAAGATPRVSGQACQRDSIKWDTVRAVLSLAPGPEAGHDQRETSVYLLIAQGVADHFVAPSPIRFSDWPGTIARPPFKTGRIAPDTFGVNGALQFNVDSMGRLIPGKTTGSTTSLVLNLALVAAMAAADSTGDLPPATLQMVSATHPLQLAVRSTSSVQPRTVPFVSLRLPVMVAETPPIIASPGTLEYPDIALRLERQDNVEFQFVVDTNGLADPASITVLSAHYPEFVEAATWTIKGSRFHPALAHGCPVPVRVRETVKFIRSRSAPP
jgi:hypothetical protein